MPSPRTIPALDTLKNACSDGAGGADPAGLRQLPRRFHELGYAVIKSNLALKYPDFDPEATRRQYERMLGTRLEESFDLAFDAVVDPCTFDTLGRLYEDAAHANGSRKGTGEFYTPPSVVEYMIDLLELEKDEGLPDRKLIDIACGTGAFLVAGMRRVIGILDSRDAVDAEMLRRAVGGFYGMDISQTACDICKINLYATLLNELGPGVVADAGEIRFNVFTANAIDNGEPGYGAPDADGAEAGRIKRRHGRYRDGFDYIVGNPPYLDAKKMPAALKATCRANWPAITGAFDLYIPFILQCNRLAADGGRVCQILPDKFTVAGYARPLREKLLRDCTLVELADLAGTGVFNKAMVYPIVLAYDQRPPPAGHEVRTRLAVRRVEELADGNNRARVPQDLYRAIGHHYTLFGLPEKGGIAGTLRRIFAQGKPIGDYVAFRSAVSFHKKGLREQFVRPSFNGATGPVLKYLGGRSFAKRNEVGPFQFRWEGYYIDYDRARLKAQDNPLPPLSGFTQEKIVLCQHAPRITAAYDGAGEYVTKDVYPIGIAAPGLAASPLSLKYFTVLLNSELMSFLYGTVYKGIQIGGGYYHYLPTWLDILPVVVPERRDVRLAEGLADEIMAGGRAARLRSMRRADEMVYRTYGIGAEQRTIIRGIVPPWNGADD